MPEVRRHNRIIPVFLPTSVWHPALAMFIIKLLVLNILGCVCAHSISRAPTNGDSINGTEAKLTMRKVVKALGGPDALNVIDGFTYTADE